MSERVRQLAAERQAAWNALRVWTTERGSGTWSAFREAARFCQLNPLEAARKLTMLGHMELSWDLDRWAAAPPCLVAVVLPEGRLWLTGGIDSDLPERVDAALDEQGVDAAVVGPFHEGGRGPSTWHVEARPELWPQVAEATHLPLVLEAACRMARSLPDADRVGSPHLPDDRFPAAPIDPDTLRPAWGRPIEVDTPAIQLIKGGRPVWWVLNSSGAATRLPSSEWAAWLAQRVGSEPRLAYDPDGTLRVDSVAPLPPLHARAACFSTGRLPARAHKAVDIAEDRYRAVPQSVADAIVSTLRPQR